MTKEMCIYKKPVDEVIKALHVSSWKNPMPDGTVCVAAVYKPEITDTLIERYAHVTSCCTKECPGYE